ncbi:hypothetical protein Acr_00g0061080 [Actinidia rufa]|uniref:CCHC-type domain-containing protein n=1 Tax=Actinidia rufa TaxID=165716 RepID=A0A7J0DP40_9ERIC|nr:hypothetical protein Acr_00g0061080 [Actinidia rufa]
MAGRGRGVVVRLDGGAGRGNPTLVVPEAHSGAGGRETTLDVPVIPSQFAREVAAAMLEMERTRHEEIRIHREVTSACFREGMKEFRKMNPPSFDGLGDPVVAGHCQRIQNFSDLLDCARRVEPKKEQRKDFKGSWELRQMSVGTSSTTSGSFNKKRQRDSTQGSVGQQMYGVSILASSPNLSNPGRILKSQIVCHRCNQPGHICSECPQRQRNQQQRNQSQQSRHSVASERGSRMERGDASTTSKQFSGQRGGHVQSQGVQGRFYAITDATTIPSQTEPSVVRDCYRRRVRVCTSEGEWFSFVGEKSDPLETSLSDPRSRESISCILARISDEGMITRGKANVVADALSRKVPGKLAKVASLEIREWKMMGEIGEFGVELVDSTGRVTLYGLVAQPTLVNQVIEAQRIDEEAEVIRAKLMMEEEHPGWAGGT